MAEYDALCERHFEQQDFWEYLAALSPWATFNVNRSKDAGFMDTQAFMMRRAARLAMQGRTQPASAPAAEQPGGWRTPALLTAPAPPQGMRWAKPGERPPSRFAPGQPDDVIDRFDAYREHWKHGVKHG